MTTFDMIVLATMWTDLSAASPGLVVQELTLPGDMTGREDDRQFKCELTRGAPSWDTNAGDDWEGYLAMAVDYVDFLEKGREDQ